MVVAVIFRCRLLFAMQADQSICIGTKSNGRALAMHERRGAGANVACSISLNGVQLSLLAFCRLFVRAPTASGGKSMGQRSERGEKGHA